MADVEDVLSRVDDLGLGEVVLQSVDRDGTGQGFPLREAKKAWQSANIPFIAAGGFGSTTHISECLVDERVEAVITANLLAFLGNGLSLAREEAVAQNVEIARWEEFASFSAGTRSA
jgi:cyclase